MLGNTFETLKLITQYSLCATGGILYPKVLNPRVSLHPLLFTTKNGEIRATECLEVPTFLVPLKVSSR